MSNWHIAPTKLLYHSNVVYCHMATKITKIIMLMDFWPQSIYHQYSRQMVTCGSYFHNFRWFKLQVTQQAHQHYWQTRDSILGKHHAWKQNERSMSYICNDDCTVTDNYFTAATPCYEWENTMVYISIL